MSTKSSFGSGPSMMLKPALHCSGPQSLSDFILTLTSSTLFEDTAERGGISLDHEDHKKKLREVIAEIRRTGEVDIQKLGALLGPRTRTFESIHQSLGLERAIAFIEPAERLYYFRDAEGIPRMKFESEMEEEDYELYHSLHRQG